VAKYDPLVQHLRNAQSDSVRLAFSEVETLIGERLPPSARTYVAWWANSATNDTHGWAHAWQAAGWRAKVQIANGTVEFTRAEPVSSALDALKPTAKPTVMSLVQAAGIDVRGWGFVDDRPYSTPASNPNYCYEWAFGSPHEGYVVCVWHSSLDEQKGRIVYNCDIGTYARGLRLQLASSGLTDARRGRLLKWVKRAEFFEVAVRDSFLSGRPLQLILNLGDTRDDDKADAPDSVSERALDSERWYVHTFVDGDGVIVRGEAPSSLEGPSDAEEPADTPGKDDKLREGQIRVRQGQAEFRGKLLEAYGRRCAVTGTLLEPLLEAAHIVPHAEGTDYRVTNGLLLRADIHTLYDLYHLSIDERCTIHLSRTAKQTDYAQYHGKKIRLPDKLSGAPSHANLASRHERFLEREQNRI